MRPSTGALSLTRAPFASPVMTRLERERPLHAVFLSDVLCASL